VDVDHTKFTSVVFATAGIEDSPSARAMVRAFNESAVHFNRQVFDEDKTICEGVHQGIRAKQTGQGILSQEEERILAFHTHYQEKWDA
jgi:phenylpropionate dioxygenase-like ring-hydroxylating dioxygenase large terminal subunit